MRRDVDETQSSGAIAVRLRLKTEFGDPSDRAEIEKLSSSIQHVIEPAGAVDGDEFGAFRASIYVASKDVPTDLQRIMALLEERDLSRSALIEVVRIDRRSSSGNKRRNQQTGHGNRQRRAHIGDVVMIPLSDGRLAYAQIVYSAEAHFPRENRRHFLGQLVRVFDLITDQDVVSINELSGRNLLFPPVFTMASTCIRTGRWKVIGTLPYRDFVFPTFREAGTLTLGVHHDWALWDGMDETFLGNLPAELRSLEIPFTYTCKALEDRIDAGGPDWSAGVV